MKPSCDWCGRPATTQTCRTTNEGTEYENTSSYWECDECNRIATKELENAYTILCTFPDNEANYCKLFVVETAWLKQGLTMHGKQGRDNEEREDILRRFLDEYTWGETHSIYLTAVARNKLISEEEQA